MRFLSWAALLTALALGSRLAQAADLAKMERSLAKEPAYQGKPAYCLLVFGPEAKFRVWLVQDGDVLYVDRNGTGDLSAKDNRVALSRGPVQAFQVGTLKSADGKTYAQLRVEVYPTGRALAVAGEGKRWFFADFTPGGRLQFGDTPATAPVIHFDGPLVLSVTRARLQTIKGEDQLHFSVYLGTVGLGQGTFAYTSASSFKIADHLRPALALEFAAGEAGMEPIRLTCALEKDG